MSKLKLISAADTQYPASLLRSINDERHSGLLCDVTIIVQDRKFKAHKCVLSASSTYFHQLFSVAGHVIELNFIKADIFDVILNYIYTSKIYRVRSDRLEDLISAGQALGVTFIANLGTPLAQVKGLPGLSKESDNNSISSSEKNETGGENMPIITETFSLSAEEFNMACGNTEKEVDSDSDDVLFVSKTEAPQAQKTKISDGNDKAGGPEAKKQKVTNAEGIASKDSTAQERNNQLSSERDTSLQNNLEPQPDVVLLSNPEASSSVLTSPVRANSNSEPTTPADVNSLPSDPHSTSLPLDNNEVLGVHKKKVLLEHSPDQPGKIRLSDVRPTYSTNNGPVPAINLAPSVLGKKTITLDKASEIDSLSPGCKVYANIGENTYDIVPVKEDPVEGSAPGRKSQIPHSVPSVTIHSPQGKKNSKLEQEDHYELIMDGKTFYVCIVCKRPYVCLTSLRRHFNTHSWERKYPCHYCSKVFALAEYRTKHEITHTGERRYQCLLCNETFLNYQILSTHCKQTHNQDPSGRKEKDDSCNNLYRLLPCKTLQFKPYSFVSEEPGGNPVIGEDGTVQHVNPDKEHFTNQPLPASQSKALTWDDIFVESEAQNRPVAHVRPGPPPRPIDQINAETRNEFEFVIPETY
ncbi:transcriptional regulator Kaiso-like [Sinocyclocheilus anshuiensis]|uniref:Transcriptional regulator Kaiso-like n=1 Tax=Sinocyclocheilus anshuiensis TaxID=1608454 RepID=A0A671PN88_9TELE|nr:PREDICTED: transcriptional regulator Kaiso-like [Sinocyclocheilus anshuiensis]XP_016310364.1 PREDICTED: transcriptional regulator Kaiso-like [Sinocyclocheilus anshuiensis]